ncbi:ribonucleoside triphosphate reductase [Patescibacteria group bacterium]|nr:ribonucleoside triphosphate reductase [Patescibacteria group bacterium]
MLGKFHSRLKQVSLFFTPFHKTKKGIIMPSVSNEKIFADLVKNYLREDDWLVKENSNMSYSLQGLNNYMAAEISKKFWLNTLYPQDIAQAHIDGDYHIHDLGIISVYCVGWDLMDLLRTGFGGVSGKIESRPPKHFKTALLQSVNFLYTMQGESAGAQAFSNFDTLLAPFIYYDNLNYHEVKQALQEFVFNINVPTRVGFQTPFTNITFDLEVPNYFQDQRVVVGGETKNKSYGEFKDQMDLLNRAFLEVMLEGDAKGRVFTFPIPTYNITKDFNWDNKNLDNLWKVTAKYGLPYFANYVNSDMQPEDARSMCCRLRIDNRELIKRGGGLFGSSPLTGSIGVVTINLPRLGKISQNEEEFLQRLDDLMILAKKSLELKRDILEKYMDDGLYPYSKHYLRNVKARFDNYWQNHFSTIGIIGMNESCLNLFGQDITRPASMEFTTKVMKFMRKRMIDFQKETGNNYNLEATPGEGISYRLPLLDKRKFKDDITCANESDYRQGQEPYYTNSTHLPVNYTDDIFEVLDLQNEVQSMYTGGTVVHLFIGEKIDDTNALKNLIKKICDNYHLPYFSITPTFSICPNCGYLDSEVLTCPTCRSQCEVYSRIVGYLRPVQQWHKGKAAEYINRKTLRITDEDQWTAKNITH